MFFSNYKLSNCLFDWRYFFLNGNLRLFFLQMKSRMGSLNFYTSHYIATFKRPSVWGYFKQTFEIFSLFYFFVLLRYTTRRILEIISHWFYIGLIFSYTGFNKEICSVKENTHVFGFNCFWTVLLLWILGVIELLCKIIVEMFSISCCFLLLLET
jgi:uncharacterized membrane protein